MESKLRLGKLSLTRRLTLFFTVVAAAVVLGLGGLFLVEIEQHFVELDRMALQEKRHLIEEILGNANSVDDASLRLSEALNYHHDLYVLVQNPQGERIFQSSTSNLNVQSGDALSTEETSVFGVWRHHDTEFHTLSFGTAPAYSASALQVLIAADTKHHTQFLTELRSSLAFYVIAAIIVCGLLSWLAARQGLAPLREMKSRAAVVTGQKLSERMPVEAVPVEMADLAHSLNEMLERLQRDFQRLSEFSSDLAHELRTPISNLLTQTQVALAQPRDAAAYREILASNAEEFQRLARMVSDMLLLAKAEHGLLLPHTEAIALADEVRALFDFYEALAEEKQIRLRCSGAAVLSGDRLMLRRAISNLLSNALRHTPPRGRVEVLIDSLPEAVSLRVENSGSTIAPELLPRLFDRFFRADKSRAHSDTDGAGLGLAITQAIVQAHGGQASVTSTEGQTCFTLRFPRP